MSKEKEYAEAQSIASLNAADDAVRFESADSVLRVFMHVRKSLAGWICPRPSICRLLEDENRRLKKLVADLSL